MHSIEELGTNVPAFLAKLWKMVEDPETNDLICWSLTGTSFFIRDQARFARELLPLYYKHNNMASFVRQLNMYGFHKVVSIESGGLKVDKDEMEFAHQCFLMGHPYLLEHIKRKIPVNKSEDGRSGTKPELVNKVLNDVKSMKGRQDSLDSQLNAMKRENEVLWREVAILRQKHMKQQQIVNKLIQFLVSMVQSSRGGGISMKRHYPLMLNDITNRPNKSPPKVNAEVSENNHVSNDLSPTGPVIHELDPAELFDDCETVAEEVSNNDFLATNLCSAEIGEVRSPASPAAKDPLGETGPDVLLELAEDYQLNPDVLISVTPAEINSTTDNLKTQKPKMKQDFSKTRKRKNKACNNYKNKVVPVKRNRQQDSVVLEKIEKGYCNGYSKTERLAPSRPETPDVQISLVEANDAAVSAISNAAATAVTKTEVIDSSNLSPDCNVFVVNESLTTDEQPAPSTTNGASDMTLARTGNSANECSGINREELDSHLESMQNDLDGLKELLKGEGYSLDATTLLGVRPAVLGLEQDALLKLFGGDDLVSYGIHVTPGSENEDKRKDNVSDPLVSGNELMTYPAEILDFSDMCQNAEEEWILPSSPDLNFTNAASLEQDTAGSDLSTPNPQIVGTPKAVQ